MHAVVEQEHVKLCNLLLRLGSTQRSVVIAIGVFACVDNNTIPLPQDYQFLQTESQWL